MKNIFSMIYSFFMASIAQAACPDFSGKYFFSGPIEVTQSGCEKIVIRNIDPRPGETLQVESKLDGSELPRRGNDTWVEGVHWDGNLLVFTSRYSDAYLATGVKIGDHVDTKKICTFKLLESGDVSFDYQVFGIKGQPVQQKYWYSGILKRIP